MAREGQLKRWADIDWPTAEPKAQARDWTALQWKRLVGLPKLDRFMQSVCKSTNQSRNCKGVTTDDGLRE